MVRMEVPTTDPSNESDPSPPVGSTSLEPSPKFFGNGSEFKAATTEYTVKWEPIANISTTEAQVCYISEIRDENPMPSFKLPETVREIHFDSFISHQNFLSLVTPLVNVKLLEIHLSSLESLEFSNTGNACLDLPNVECLEISSVNFTYLHAQTSNLIGIIDNVKAILILPTNFPKLTYLSISLPTYPPKDEDFAKAILTCIAQHKTTLRYVNFEAEYTLLNDSNGTFFEDKLYREALGEDERSQNTAAIQAASVTQLASLHYFSLIKSASSELWRKFMEGQGSLEYIQFWCEEFCYPFPKDLVQRNHALVHTVALNVDVLSSENPLPTTTTIDLAVFRQCPHLKVIFLKGNSKYSTNLGKPPDVCNGTLLPMTLECVKFLNILVDKDDVSFIMKSLTNIRSLLLRQIGEYGGYGVKFADLASLLERETLQKIELVAAINQEDLERRGESGSETVAKILFTRQIFSCFKARRTSDGGFECLSDDDYDDDDTVTTSDEDEDEDGAQESEEASTPRPASKVQDNQGNIVSNNNSSTSSGVSCPSPTAISVEEINAELVDADEANLDLFVQDFSSSREPPS